MKIEINIEKKHLFILAIILAVSFAAFAIAYGTSNPQNFGHSLSEISGIDANGNGVVDNAEHAISADRLNYVSGQKICSAVLPGNWRDTVIVPSTWTKTTCAEYKTQQAATNYQLGCIFDTGFRWGTIDGGIPSPNCGWS